MFDVFQRVGVPANDAAVCADVLISADIYGIDSHGIQRLKPIYIDRIIEKIINPITNIDIVRDRKTTAVVDGNNGMGQVVGKMAMQIAIDKAKEHGLGMVVARNSNHYGIAGYYARMAIHNNMIGITGTNARPSIAPTFGVENMIGTNPITFGIPTDEDFPFLLDCATSTIQRGKVEQYAKEGKSVPKGLVIGTDGSSLTNPTQILKAMIEGNAALVPLGGIGEETAGYKGYGYATVVEILSSALSGAASLKELSGYDKNGKKIPYNIGHYFIAINIEEFRDLWDFKKHAGRILRQLRESKKMPEEKRIYTAGEKEWLAWLERKDKGIPINKGTQKDIKDLVKILGLKEYDFLSGFTTS